ncbi:MAG TPA: type IV secretion system protein [Povalibacter sp.]|uniref:virB8 family protein n=1 Tax=Povalibacter sp. TaxID=1962978 RepID=UPI002B53F3C8|nr:type IV secretion system protein [Povalibacter sp.]HMN43831.1 type IV secretion system protein [Povalibacter sp.]
MEQYLTEAASWDADRAAQAQRSARIAWSVAAGAGTCATLTALAIAILMPLKRVDPFVIRVDETSGVVDVVPVFEGGVDLPQAVTRYFLDHYVTVCERFNLATAESDYEECGAFHTAQRNQVWYQQWNRANPESPLNRYRDGTVLQAQVQSISFFTRGNGVADLAQVRYVKRRRNPSGAEVERSQWIATVQYAYAKPSSDARTRRWNPLAFKIIDFRPEPELAPRQEPGASVVRREMQAP